MNRTLFGLAVFLALAVFMADQAQAQWGRNNQNRGWGGNSGWGNNNSGWGGGHNHNQGGGLGGLFGGIGKIIDNSSSSGGEYPGGSSGIRWEDVGKGLGSLGDEAIKANQGNHWPNHYPNYPSRPNYPSTVIVRPQQQTHTVYRPKTEVKANEAPIAKPEPKEERVALAKNSFSLNGNNITARDIHNTQADAQDHIDDTAEDIRDDMKEKLKNDVDKLNGLTQAERDEMKARIDRGESVDTLLPPGATPPDVANRLGRADDAFDSLDSLVNDARKGRLRPGDLNDFQNDFNDIVDTGPNLQNDLNTIAEDSFWIDLMNHAQPGLGGLPPGGGTQIVYVPNMPSGQIVNLGNGTVLVGTGGVTNGVVVMTGNACQVAGLSAGVGQPVPDSEAEEMLSGVLLLNKGEQAVNYNVNSDPFTMTPDFRQVLPGGRKWAIEFDRGGTHGKAKYGISDGTYGFTPTDTGWELYEQPPYEVTIDNTSNEFPFNYVLNNTPQTVEAGQANQHSGRYPLVVRFDNGVGEERRKSLDQGEYSLAVTQEGTLDLYESTYVEPPIQMEQVAKAPTVPGRALLELDGSRQGSLFGTRQSNTRSGGLMTFR